eukprot:12571176-Prorocentrum_lima.AAC.1
MVTTYVDRTQTNARLHQRAKDELNRNRQGDPKDIIKLSDCQKTRAGARYFAKGFTFDNGRTGGRAGQDIVGTSQLSRSFGAI